MEPYESTVTLTAFTIWDLFSQTLKGIEYLLFEV